MISQHNQVEREALRDQDSPLPTRPTSLVLNSLHSAHTEHLRTTEQRLSRIPEYAHTDFHKAIKRLSNSTLIFTLL